ncbi:uncharacterized protein [Narcine bancroftii]|uniref:uncharacterized protein isoform X1 n=1 Tax=Narcine bancroftii TaxID=1343680 RepID=UPI00383228C4
MESRVRVNACSSGLWHRPAHAALTSFAAHRIRIMEDRREMLCQPVSVSRTRYAKSSVQATLFVICSFSDMFVRWPGHTHDARVLANSSLDRKTEQQTGYLFACDVSKNVDGVEVQAHLVGDVAYRLRTS